MKLQKECVDCILGQAKRVASVIGADEKTSIAIEAKALEMSKQFSFTQTPPEVATPLYEALGFLVQSEDLYKQAKAKATLEVVEMLPKLQSMIDKSDNHLLAAAKMAVAGNVIDLATIHHYDLSADVQKVLDAQFGVDDFEKLFDDLKQSKRLLYLADNAGEHIFDALFMKELKRNYPDLHITYMTRDHAIINDVTLEEAKESGLGVYANLVRSGCKTPGFIYSNASTQAQELFNQSDLVIAKGMGNFETMSESEMREVYHLFKVKCNVVSNYVQHPVGTYMAMQRGLQ